MEELSMREAAKMLEICENILAEIIVGMNHNATGGFESVVIDAQRQVQQAASLLETRIYGQLAMNPTAPPYDKPLSHC